MQWAPMIDAWFDLLISGTRGGKGVIFTLSDGRLTLLVGFERGCDNLRRTTGWNQLAFPGFSTETRRRNRDNHYKIANKNLKKWGGT